MPIIANILNSTKENNGILTTAMVNTIGCSRGNISYLVKKGLLEKSSRGVYTLPEVWDDEMFNFQNRFKKGIFSLETALFLLDLTDKTPHNFTMTFPNTYNLTMVKKEGINSVQCKKEIHGIGIIKNFTPNGNPINIYNAERTICEILKPRNGVDIQIIKDSLKKYVAQKDRNIPLLSEYAKIFKVEKRLRNYLEVLLWKMLCN